MTAESGHSPTTDLELVRRARKGDPSAFHGLVDRYAASLFAMAVSLVGSAADAEDIVQETLAGAFRGIAAFEGRATVKTWLTGILLRQTAAHRRRVARREARFVALQGVADREPGLASPAGAVDTRMDVMAAIQSLSPDHRDVVVLRELEGLSYEEMAEVLGIPRGTVESRLFRARRELQGRLREYLA